jgi:nickel superoxide dismutase
MKGRMYVAAIALGLVALVSGVLAHCQIPCGIYDDDARLDALAEHITTIEKSMKQIVELSKAKELNQNQIVRWVVNKEKHAEMMDEILTYYFMAQRIKPAPEKEKAAYADYVKKLTLLHKMLVKTMKAKQSTDLGHVAELRELLRAFEQAYGRKRHKH